MSFFARLRQSLQRSREDRALQRRAIGDELWARTLEHYGFLARLAPADQAELRRLCSLFLDQKEFHGAHGFEVTDDVVVSIAAQACLPVLRLGLQPYGGFVGIVVHPDQALARREVMDEDGLVHDYDELLAGEAMDGGPIMLSWPDVHDAADIAQGGAYNVVIHEFAHVLDLGNGAADGVPRLPSRQAQQRWLDVLVPEYDRFCERVVCGYDTVMDPYGAEAIDEFFAVASEAFFVNATPMKEEQPALYRLLSSYYLQDPAGP